MLDQTTTKGRLLAAALDLAARKPWEDVTLLEIAEAAGVGLAELRDACGSKTDLIKGLLRAVDDEVLKAVAKPAADQGKRDLLFDVVMTRFDILAPHKAALKSIYASGGADFSLAAPYLASQHWMLQAAGISTEGAGGALRVAGLALAYASVFRTWLDDDDPGHARTMAALDRRLRRGERTMQSIDSVTTTLNRLATDGPEFLRSVLRGRPRSQPQPEGDATAKSGGN